MISIPAMAESPNHENPLVNLSSPSEAEEEAQRKEQKRLRKSEKRKRKAEIAEEENKKARVAEDNSPELGRSQRSIVEVEELINYLSQ